MDDEKFFRLSNYNVLGNEGYYTDNKDTAPPDIKYKMISKFESKVMVWVAFSVNGISDLYVHKSMNAIDNKTYIKECLNKRLLPFVRESHAYNSYVFWPDLATAHYANNSTNPGVR